MPINLDNEQASFLISLKANGPTFNKGLPFACRKQDRARQKARKQGLATYDRKVGWSLTPDGRAAIDAVVHEGYP